MSEKIVEGIWDCPYCGAEGIGGLKKYCPNCGHPQDKGTCFRLGEEKHYLSEEEQNGRGAGPDWACEYCDSLNNAKFSYCKNCGAERTAENKDYFELRQEEQKTEQKNGQTNAVRTDRSSSILDLYTYSGEKRQRPSFSWKNVLTKLKTPKMIGVMAILLCLIIGLAVSCLPREYAAVLTEKSWQREIDIEEYKTVEESAWDRIPSGGRLLYTQDEIRSYRQVFSHYETRTRQVAEQVFDGYDTSTYYTDNGDGTFTEHTSQTPRYRTEYHTETYEEPIYVDVPVYDVKYYYEIERWVYERCEKSAGADQSPYWAEYILDDNERTAETRETYMLTFVTDKKQKTYSYTCASQEEWDAYRTQDSVVLVISNGKIEEIKRK